MVIALVVAALVLLVLAVALGRDRVGGRVDAARRRGSGWSDGSSGSSAGIFGAGFGGGDGGGGCGDGGGGGGSC